MTRPPAAIQHVKIEPYIPPAMELEPVQESKHPEPTSKYLYGYLRVSTTDQMASGLGLEDQKRRVLAYIEYLLTQERYAGYKFAGIYVEEPVSSRKVWLRNRKVGAVLWNRLRPGDSVIFAFHNRAFRNRQDAVESKAIWDRQKITFHMTDMQIDTGTVMGEYIFFGFVNGAAWQAALTSEATKHALRSKKVRGEQMGIKGYRSGGRARTCCRMIRWVDPKTYENHAREVIDKDLVPIMRLAAYYRDALQLPWTEISDRIEAMLAKRQNRPIVPQISFRNIKRDWTADRLRASYRTWKWLHEVEWRRKWWNFCA